MHSNSYIPLWGNKDIVLPVIFPTSLSAGFGHPWWAGVIDTASPLMTGAGLRAVEGPLWEDEPSLLRPLDVEWEQGADAEPVPLTVLQREIGQLIISPFSTYK